jgi:hypothetical protein
MGPAPAVGRVGYFRIRLAVLACHGCQPLLAMETRARSWYFEPMPSIQCSRGRAPPVATGTQVGRLNEVEDT